MTKPVNWIPVDETAWVCDIGPRKMQKCNHKARIILIRTINKKGELAFCYFCTTLPWSCCNEVDVFHFYNRRVTIEKMISRSKNVLHITHLPTHHFEGLQLALSLRFLAYNLILWYQSHVLGQDDSFSAMKVFELVSTVASSAVVTEEKQSGWKFFLKNTPDIVQKMLIMTKNLLRQMAQKSWTFLGEYCQRPFFGNNWFMMFG